MKTIYCTNCGKIGHNYKNCKNPIISYGIMLFKYYNNNLYLLLIQRKDSISYIEFIRGKYSITNTNKLLTIPIYQNSNQPQIVVMNYITGTVIVHNMYVIAKYD